MGGGGGEQGGRLGKEYVVVGDPSHFVHEVLNRPLVLSVVLNRLSDEHESPDCPHHHQKSPGYHPALARDTHK